MPERQLPTGEILALLAEGPKRIAAQTKGLAPAQLRAAPSEGEWSANEVLAHLRACGDMWGGAIGDILAGDKPTLTAINPRTWIKRTNYLELEFQPSLRAYTQQRKKLLALLAGLAPKDWQRSAIVRVAGKPLKRTVHLYAQWMALHERPHLKQMEHIAASLRGG